MTRRTYATPEESFLARTEPIVGDPGCIIWTGALNSSGYGRMSVKGRDILTHRYAWERVNGPIPERMLIDHMCWERSCVNVDHLRLATNQQNLQNRSGTRRGRKYDLPRGVSRNGGGYSARVKHADITYCLGTFSTTEEASMVAQAKRKELFGEYAGAA